jgi:hypothetical protein
LEVLWKRMEQAGQNGQCLKYYLLVNDLGLKEKEIPDRRMYDLGEMEAQRERGLV